MMKKSQKAMTNVPFFRKRKPYYIDTYLKEKIV